VTGSASAGFGLYVHWPWCRRICPYCDFNVYRARDADIEPMVRAIEESIRLWPAYGAPERTLDSIHFGGGTPSLAPPEAIERITGAAKEVFGLSRDVEIGLEANPEDADENAWGALRKAGVERLSLGVQSLDDQALTALGRMHTAEDGRCAIGLAQDIFPRVSADLIAARHGQTAAAWTAELREALSLGLTHLSIYQLTIEDGTAFARQTARGALRTPDEDLAAEIYEITQAMTADAGVLSYEVSNHAAGPDHRSRHNLLYWRSGDWIAAGPGAHARLWGESGARLAYAAPRRPEDFIASVAAGAPATLEETLDAEASAAEMILMGLRLSEGLDLTALTARTGFTPGEKAVARLRDDGLITIAPDRLTATAAGRLVLDRVAAELIP
jgi:oxygen-independent coproporphyrinogen-3 oxidase